VVNEGGIAAGLNHAIKQRAGGDTRVRPRSSRPGDTLVPSHSAEVPT